MKEGNIMGFFSKLFGKNEETLNPNHLYAPMAGAAVPVTEVPDPTFAEGMLGDGIAIIPTSKYSCGCFPNKIHLSSKSFAFISSFTFDINGPSPTINKI